MPTRILHLVPRLEPSAVVEQLRLLVTGLSKEEFVHHVCTLSLNAAENSTLDLQPAQFTSLDQLRPFDLAAWRRLIETVRVFRPDILHTWSLGALKTALLVRALRFRGRAIVSLRAAETVMPWPASLWQRQAISQLEQIVVRDSAAEFGLRSLNLQTPVTLIPDGVRQAKVFSPECRQIARQRFAADFAIPPERRVVATIARLEHASALRDLIWAIDLLKVIRPDVYLLIVGDGPQRDTLVRYALNSQIVDRVRFLGLRNDVDDWLPAVDVYAQPGQPITPPNSLLRALAAGIPVVAANCAIARNLAAPTGARHLVEAGDRSGFAREINRLLNDAELARLVASGGAERVARSFSVDAMLGRYHALYRQEQKGR
jgi:glycosyltransferase involved in cell wall biosynthesis